MNIVSCLFVAFNRSVSQDGSTHEVIIRFATEMQTNDHFYTQFLNIVMNQCLEKLNLDRVGRDYFDSRVRITFSAPLIKAVQKVLLK